MKNLMKVTKKEIRENMKEELAIAEKKTREKILKNRISEIVKDKSIFEERRIFMSDFRGTRGTITFGDSFYGYGRKNDYTKEELKILLNDFPPVEKIFLFKKGCTWMHRLDTVDEKSEGAEVNEINSVWLEAEGLDQYRYKVCWMTELVDGVFMNMEVYIDFGRELIKIEFKYNQQRSSQKYHSFKFKSLIDGYEEVPFYGTGDNMKPCKLISFDINSNLLNEK